MRTFLQQHAASVIGALSGFDRLRFRGTLRSIANAGGLTSCLNCIGVQMDAAGIEYLRRDNCFTWIKDLAAAQELADRAADTATLAAA